MSRALSMVEVERLRDLVTERLGLAFADERLALLASVAAQRMHALGVSGLPEYLRRLEGQAAREELLALAGLLTVPETFFFRGEEQFRALAEALQERATSRDRRVRILSAGCASGEEPYSIIMALRESLRAFESWNVSVDAFDVNPLVIEKAERGRYGAWSLRATSEALKRRYFSPHERAFLVSAEVRAAVRFSCQNLVSEQPLAEPEAPYDAIFCRNVLMYFEPNCARRIVGRFERALASDGQLFLGHAETLRGVSQDFRLCHRHGAFYYQKASEGVAMPAPPMPAPPMPAPPMPAPRTTLAREPGLSSWIENIELASARVRALTQRSPGARANRSPPQSSWDLDQILALLREERFSQALELLQAVPSSSHSRADVLLLLAVTLTNKGAGEPAEAACRRLLEVDGGSAGAHYLLALCREQAADSAGAIACDRRAIYLDSTFAMAHLHLGLMAKRSRDWELAGIELERALCRLDREDEARLLLFGGGFSRVVLMRLCCAELSAMGALR